MSFGRLGALGRGFGHLGGGKGGLPAIPNTLRAGAGSFILTGTDMTPKSAYVVPAALGTFALTGVAATLTSTAANYSGPGDINGAAKAWFGLRGFSAAYSTGSNPAVDLVDQAGANPITINILSNGSLDVASIATWVTAHTVTTIKITKLYDQSGNNVHLLQATLGNMPNLVLNSIGSLPGIVFLGTTTKLVSSATITQAQPFTVSAVAKRTTVFSNDCLFVSVTAGVGILFSVTSGNMAVSGGNVPMLATASENNFHAAQGKIVNAAAGLYIDGSNTTGSGIGTADWSADTLAMGGGALGALAGVVLEAGAWNGDLSANNSAMNSNQHTYWGF